MLRALTSISTRCNCPESHLFIHDTAALVRERNVRSIENSEDGYQSNKEADRGTTGGQILHDASNDNDTSLILPVIEL